jgi:hypothetical protein
MLAIMIASSERHCWTAESSVFCPYGKTYCNSYSGCKSPWIVDPENAGVWPLRYYTSGIALSSGGGRGGTGTAAVANCVIYYKSITNTPGWDYVRRLNKELAPLLTHICSYMGNCSPPQGGYEYALTVAAYSIYLGAPIDGHLCPTYDQYSWLNNRIYYTGISDSYNGVSDWWMAKGVTSLPDIRQFQKNIEAVAIVPGVSIAAEWWVKLILSRVALYNKGYTATRMAANPRLSPFTAPDLNLQTVSSQTADVNHTTLMTPQIITVGPPVVETESVTSQAVTAGPCLKSITGWSKKYTGGYANCTKALIKHDSFAKSIYPMMDAVLEGFVADYCYGGGRCSMDTALSASLSKKVAAIKKIIASRKTGNWAAFGDQPSYACQALRDTGKQLTSIANICKSQCNQYCCVDASFGVVTSSTGCG